MSCNTCKKTDRNQQQINSAAFADTLFMRLFIFALATVFALAALIPIIIPVLLIVLFNHIVMKRNTDFNKPLLWIGKKLRTSKKRDDGDDEDEEEYEDVSGEGINPEDYELMDVDVIR